MAEAAGRGAEPLRRLARRAHRRITSTGSGKTQLHSRVTDPRTNLATLCVEEDALSSAQIIPAPPRVPPSPHPPAPSARVLGLRRKKITTGNFCFLLCRGFSGSRRKAEPALGCFSGKDAKLRNIQTGKKKLIKSRNNQFVMLHDDDTRRDDVISAV